MKRSYLGAALLAVLLVLGFLTVRIAENCSPIVSTLEEASQAALEERWEEADAHYAEALSAWQDHWNLLAALTDHEPMARINEQFAQAKAFLEAQNEEEAAASLAQLSRQVQSLIRDHRLTWWNIM